MLSGSAEELSAGQSRSFASRGAARQEVRAAAAAFPAPRPPRGPLSSRPRPPVLLGQRELAWGRWQSL